MGANYGGQGTRDHRRQFENGKAIVCLYGDGNDQVENQKLMMPEMEANFRSEVIED